MECARLYEWVALIAGLDPDSVRAVEERFSPGRIRLQGVDENFKMLLQIAEASMRARTLVHHGNSLELPVRSMVLRSVFLTWARSKDLPIPAELTSVDGAGTAAANASDDTTIKGIDGLRAFIIELGGPVIGDPAAVRRFAKKAGVMADGDNPQHLPRSWKRAEIESKLMAAIEKWRQSGTQ